MNSVDTPTAPTPLIYQKMAAILADVPAVEKTKKPGSQLNYAFRSVDDVVQAVGEMLAKHQVFYAPTVLERERSEGTTKNGGVIFYTTIKMRFRFFAIDGSYVDCEVIGEAMDTSDKSSNKAMTAAQKVCLCQVFNIPTSDQKDTEYQNHELASKGKPGTSKAPRMPQQGISGTQNVSPPAPPPPVDHEMEEMIFKAQAACSDEFTFQHLALFKGRALGTIGRQEIGDYLKSIEKRASKATGDVLFEILILQEWVSR